MQFTNFHYIIQILGRLVLHYFRVFLFVSSLFVEVKTLQKATGALVGSLNCNT